MLKQIRKDFITARKEHSPLAPLYGTLIGEMETKQKSFSPSRDLSDAEIVAVVQKFIKNADETISHLEKSGDSARLDAMRAERAALEVYLPKQLTNDEIEAFVNEKAEEGLNLGQIMGALKSEHAGRYDGKAASEIVKSAMAARTETPRP